MNLQSIARVLHISKANLTYYIVRYIRKSWTEGCPLDVIGRITFLRKLGYSSQQINVIAEYNYRICELKPSCPHNLLRDPNSKYYKRKWKSLTFDDCAEAIVSLDLCKSTPWYDIIGFGRLLDSESIIFAVSGFLFFILYGLLSNCLNFLRAFFLSILAAISHAIILTICDLLWKKENINLFQKS